MTLTRNPAISRLRPPALLKLALRRMAGVAILLLGMALLHEMASPATPAAAGAAASAVATDSAS
jgi:hypothetical protein